MVYTQIVSAQGLQLSLHDRPTLDGAEPQPTKECDRIFGTETACRIGFSDEVETWKSWLPGFCLNRVQI